MHNLIFPVRLFWLKFGINWKGYVVAMKLKVWYDLRRRTSRGFMSARKMIRCEDGVNNCFVRWKWWVNNATGHPSAPTRLKGRWEHVTHGALRMTIGRAPMCTRHLLPRRLPRSFRCSVGVIHMPLPPALYRLSYFFIKSIHVCCSLMALQLILSWTNPNSFFFWSSLTRTM